ncbi:glycerophosphoryl diester phosphodiesterase [Histoplasma capsulatum G186AR]|uniref:glycerophosphodiester phosphodiesterase n=2 Tax=Ajellomyces capsulatus TaxID=5037 RepID=C0NY84_AJECG|nr:glycerophosphoryl diester phosphodiesterase [Histoplasma capsulatum G186AR]EEH03752.1 glycerophosphoryl diester phosphodiesterase [Histoplasma capsulatum G186AR]KAG5293674.1 glycerophosphoryl diester phosphodiesterase [Histoplasma capsulatum]QSS75126.1 glycerophosphoryl diester phosphodiesterase [Histoplasma capsulatum G186AR]
MFPAQLMPERIPPWRSDVEKFPVKNIFLFTVPGRASFAMHLTSVTLLVGALAPGLTIAAPPPHSDRPGWPGWPGWPGRPRTISNIQIGPRPFYLVDQMDEGSLKKKLESCKERRNTPSDFSISHRGAPLQFPEHTKESWLAAAREGAGIIECDVAFTKDLQLVCRHSQCDLHTTTNILTVPELAAKCTKPFTPASADGKTKASAKCCTSDITLAEFKSLCGKMDSSDPTAMTPEQYQSGVMDWRTSLYNDDCPQLHSHAEFISLINSLGLKFTSELKTPEVPMPFPSPGGKNYTQEMYAQQLVDEFRAARIQPSRVFLQSFLPADIFYWIDKEPAFARQAIYLDERVDTPEGYEEAVRGMRDLAKRGVRIMGPPIFALLDLEDDGDDKHKPPGNGNGNGNGNNKKPRIVPSTYAKAAKKAGLDLVTWSLERSGPLKNVAADKEYYYQTVAGAVDGDGDVYDVVDALAKRVGVKGMFSDWPATVTYYANCMGK